MKSDINRKDYLYFKKIVQPSEDEKLNHAKYLKSSLKKNYFN